MIGKFLFGLALLELLASQMTLMARKKKKKAKKRKGKRRGSRRGVM